MLNTFGERLNELIEELGMKKVQFAKELDVDQSYISQMISGKTSGARAYGSSAYSGNTALRPAD